jgi:carotenoid cleavage dioxygenase-like enzyme
MFGITENFIVLPLSSVKMDSKMLFSEMLNAKPLINALIYDPEQNYIYKIFNKKTFRWELVEFESEPGVQTHLINAYESSPGVVKIDTLLAGNGDAMSLMMFEHMNSTGQDLLDVFELMAPIGTTTQYELDMSKLDMGANKKITIAGRPMFPEDVDKNEASEWKCFHQGGIEFPILDFKNSMGKDYDHFWVNGFGTAMPDRIYHVKISTRERWVYMEEGYSPSEPGFMKNPTGTEDDDGIVVTVMSPFHDPELRPFIAFLHGKTLEELGRAYSPENIKIPVGFHGLWVPYED